MWRCHFTLPGWRGVRGPAVRCLLVLSLPVLCLPDLCPPVMAAPAGVAALQADAGVPPACRPGNGGWEKAASEGRLAWQRRAEGARGSVAAAGPIGVAVACWQEALRRAPERWEPRVQLLRALYYQGEYAATTDERRREIFERGRELFEESRARLEAEIGLELREAEPERIAAAMEELPEARELVFFGTVHWGLWAQAYGTMASIREGVVKKIRDFSEIVLAVSPDVAHGAAHRLMGRLHTRSPRVPFFTMWIDRDYGIDQLEIAVDKDPVDPLNLAFLADAVAEYGKDRERARELLDRALAMEPRADHLVEDRKARETAREILQEHGLGR